MDRFVNAQVRAVLVRSGIEEECDGQAGREIPSRKGVKFDVPMEKEVAVCRCEGDRER